MEGHETLYIAVIAILAAVALLSVTANIWLVSRKSTRSTGSGPGAAVTTASQRPAEPGTHGTAAANIGHPRIYSDTPSQWFWETGPDLRFTYVSESYEDDSNLDRKDVLGRRREELSAFDPTDEAWRSHLADLEAHRPFRDFVYSIRTRDGLLNWYSTSGEPRFNLDGAFLGYRGAGANITRAIETENRLRVAEERFNAVMDHAPVKIIIKDAESRYLQVNRYWENRYGLTNEDVVGKSIEEVRKAFPDRHANTFFRQDVADFFASVDNAVLKEGKASVVEETMPDPDGTERSFLTTRYPTRDQDGKVNGLVLIGTDITDTKRAEQALRESEATLKAIIDNSPAAIYLKDLEGRFLLANREYLNWYGLTEESIRGRTSRDLFPDEVAATFMDQDREVIATKNVIEREEEIVGKDGAVQTVVMSKFPVFDPQGQLVAVGGVDVDITERKRLEEILLRNERLATMGQLTGTVAHELRNPLGAIATSVSVIRHKAAEAKLDLGRTLERVERGIARCDKIITELLDFARAKGLQPGPAALDGWLSDLVAEQDIPAGVEVSCDFGTAGAVLSFDQDELRRAVINVIDNACQAMTAPGKEGDAGRPASLAVSTRRMDDRVEITLADTGPGIPSENLSQVMEPLYSTKAFGTGLGLPTVQRIMEEHGGGIEIDSARGRGTRVVLWLPAADREGAARQEIVLESEGR